MTKKNILLLPPDLTQETTQAFIYQFVPCEDCHTGFGCVDCILLQMLGKYGVARAALL